MPNISAVRIASIDEIAVSGDGQWGIVQLTQAEGTNVALAVPIPELLKLVPGACQVSTEAGQILGVDTKVKSAFSTMRYELETDKKTGKIVLGLVFANGGQIYFALPHGMPQKIHTQLGALIEQSNPPKPDTSIN